MQRCKVIRFSTYDTCAINKKHSSGKESYFYSKMDKLCDKCLALASSYPPLIEGENVYTKILLNQQEDHEECVKALLAAGADMNAKDYLSQTALVKAARRGHVKRLQVLMTAGADVNKHYYAYPKESICMPKCRNALKDAIETGNINCVKLLINAEANVNKVGNTEEPMLRFAIEKDNVTCADLLIKAGASVNGGHNYSPLRHDIKNKAHRCLDLLLRSGADIPSGVDPGFPVGGGANPLGGANIRFCQFFRKTA